MSYYYTLPDGQVVYEDHLINIKDPIPYQYSYEVPQEQPTDPNAEPLPPIMVTEDRQITPEQVKLFLADPTYFGAEKGETSRPFSGKRGELASVQYAKGQREGTGGETKHLLQAERDYNLAQGRRTPQNAVQTTGVGTAAGLQSGLLNQAQRIIESGVPVMAQRPVAAQAGATNLRGAMQQPAPQAAPGMGHGPSGPAGIGAATAGVDTGGAFGGMGSDAAGLADAAAGIAGMTGGMSYGGGTVGPADAVGVGDAGGGK